MWWHLISIFILGPLEPLSLLLLFYVHFGFLEMLHVWNFDQQLYGILGKIKYTYHILKLLLKFY